MHEDAFFLIYHFNLKRQYFYKDTHIHLQFEDPGVDGKIILKCIFKKWYVEEWTGSMLLRIGTSGGLL